MLVVYGTPTTRATRVVWALEEAGAAYEYRLVDLRSGAGRRPGYLSVNPTGKVPTLVDDGVVVTESLAICLHLAERFPEAGLAPARGTAERAAYLRWAAFAACELEQPLWTMAKHSFALPEALRVPAVIDTARAEFDRVADVLAAHLGEHRHVAGDAFSAADILTTHTLLWAQNRLEDFANPVLEEYAARVAARPALARAREREQAARETR